ncbi:uncharacterized protein PITG_06438 [Phytophthora infestans T30-4]|uniref:Uncharacterized protein n=1 Tax=Phytophthora infestans (strain T30-4) TaxID=403677 RepID=D0N4V5_PHYIT|nr:uncharacterized protein PITG_06438 [Phytophthora infestans T30-4]EEY69913.1 conserved hypothetical protein [Phytophthora infestans T30-4]|eukprot:XP_002998560.1 conserved hypothetical protein [Phytophthora infestans T30-4]
MHRDLPASGMPRLTSKLAVVPANPVREAHTLEEKFQEVYDQGTEFTERLEITKSRLEKELRRRSENFRDLVKTRNIDIQQEYARMLKELDDQVESLDQEIAQEREMKAERAKRRREEDLERKANKKQHLEAETSQLKEKLDEFTSEIRQLQEVFADLEKEVESQGSDNSPDDAQSVEERQRLEEERAQNEIVELQQEIVLLKEAQEAIAEKIDKQSLKAQYEEEKQEVLEETAHLKGLVEDLTPQINSSGVRQHSLLRTLAPSPGIGTLMTRLYQQLCGDSRASLSSDQPSTPRKTVDLKAFLNSCPSFEEGNRAIDELKKLQLIHCYESSGIIALAD